MNSTFNKFSRKTPPLKPRRGHVHNTPKHLILPDEDDTEHIELTSAMLEGGSIAGREEKFVTFNQVIVRRGIMSDTIFHHTTLKDSSFTGCDLANAHWPSCFWERTEIRDCRLTGLDLTEGLLQHVVLTDCKADLANFRLATLKTVVFDHCSLNRADFQGADLRRCSFRNCDLREAQMSQTKLEGADLRGSKIEGIHVEPDNLRNVTVDAFQAAYLAGLLGLIIE